MKENFATFKVSDIHRVETVADVLSLTNTASLEEAKQVVLDQHQRESRSFRSIRSRVIQGLLGAVLAYLLAQITVFIGVLLFFFSLYLAIFSSRLGRKSINKKFIALQILEGNSMVVKENIRIGNLSAHSLMLSASGVISDEAVFRSAEPDAYKWSRAGYCSISTGSDNTYKMYYVFAYEFTGVVPQVLLVHPQDKVSLPIVLDHKTLDDACPPYYCLAPEDYEIEVLSILQSDVVEKLSRLAKKSGVCSLEVVDRQVFCFVSAQTRKFKITDLLAVSEQAFAFASVLLPEVTGFKTAQIGDSALNFSPPREPLEPEQSLKPLSFKSFTKRGVLITILISTFILLVLTIPALIEMSSEEFPFMKFAGFMIPVVFGVLTILLLTSKQRKKFFNGHKFYINGRPVMFGKKSEKKD